MARLKIVYLTEHFTKKMGYIENGLPKALGRLGHDVHVVAANLQHYYHLPEYREVYEPFIGPAVQPCGVEQYDGITLHRLPHQIVLGQARIRGQARKLRALRPDVVQTIGTNTWVALEAAVLQPVLGYALFTGGHRSSCTLAPSLLNAPRISLPRLKSDIRRMVPGWFVHRFATTCYAVTPDNADVVTRFYGVPQEKCVVTSLGVDTDLFHPPKDEAEREERRRVRERLGFGPSEVVLIYTGRLTESKNALLLATAVTELRGRGKPFRGLFLGDGPQRQRIEQTDGCVVHSFVPYAELPPFYRAADVAVWPREITTSTLDAAACGLPVVMSHEYETLAPERVCGIGLTYQGNGLSDLVRVLESLGDEHLRGELGQAGAERMARDFSWIALAGKRSDDYEAARAAKGGRGNGFASHPGGV